MPDAPNHIWNFFLLLGGFFFFNDAIIVKKKKVSKKFQCTKKRSLKSFNEIRLLDVLEHSTKFRMRRKSHQRLSRRPKFLKTSEQIQFLG